MKTWKPDTCDCWVEEIYEGTTIKGGGQVLRKCVRHANVPDNELYGVLYSNPDGENKRKNRTEKHLLELNIGVLSELKTKEDGSTYLDWKPGVRFDWSFEGQDKETILNVEVVGTTLSVLKKNAVKALIEADFGRDKVNLL